MKQSPEERKRAYDAVCRNVLADRYMLANILKDVLKRPARSGSICTHPSKAWEYTITKYAMQETNRQGKAQAAREEYDLIVTVIACLGKSITRSCRDVCGSCISFCEIAAPHGYVI